MSVWLYLAITQVKLKTSLHAQLHQYPQLHNNNHTSNKAATKLKFIMPTAKRSLNILIVGAGLGGLASGLALQTDGHKVTIIDSTPEFAEVGNPLAPNT